MRLIPCLATLAAALSVAAPATGASFYATSGAGSTEVVIDTANPISWSFTAMDPYTTFEGGIFALKYAPGTTFGIGMELYDVTNGHPMASLSYTAAEFNAAAGGNGATLFSRISFDIAGTISLSTGDNYRITLGVIGNAETDTGSYRSRGTFDLGGFVVADVPDGITVASDPVDSGSGPTETPEPAAALLLASALIGLAGTRRGRQGEAALA